MALNLRSVLYFAVGRTGEQRFAGNRDDKNLDAVHWKPPALKMGPPLLFSGQS